MIRSEAVLGLPGYQITGIEERNGRVRISARYTGPRSCPHCGGLRLRNKGRRIRQLRHESWGVAALRSGTGESKVAVPGMRPHLLAAVSGHSAAQAGHRAVPAQRVSQALGRHQPQPPGAAGGHRQRHGRALVPGFPAAPRRRAQRRALPAGAGHRRALLHPPPGLRHHLL